MVGDLTPYDVPSLLNYQIIYTHTHTHIYIYIYIYIYKSVNSTIKL